MLRSRGRGESNRGLTPVEARIDRAARRLLDRFGQRPGPFARALTEFLVFGAKQAWAVVFGAAMLAVIVAAKLVSPADALLARNDALTIAAVVIQVLMVVFRLETLRELRVIVLFHLVGTAMELFKTGIGSWLYDDGGVLRVLGVPLFSGFMYAAVGSYMVRVHRLFDLRFTRYPPRWLTAIVAGAIYVNFFSHHWLPDARWVLVAAVVAMYAVCGMHARVFRAVIRMPVLASFVGVALFIWFAENIATWAGAWMYPAQQLAWHPVPVTKLVAWFLLIMVSVVLVTWVYPPRRPGRADTVPTRL